MADRWILTRLNETIERVTELFDRFEFGEAGRQLYNFIWDDFCDWYIEMSKEVLYGDDAVSKQTTRSILVHTLDRSYVYCIQSCHSLQKKYGNIFLIREIL